MITESCHPFSREKEKFVIDASLHSHIQKENWQYPGGYLKMIFDGSIKYGNACNR